MTDQLTAPERDMIQWLINACDLSPEDEAEAARMIVGMRAAPTILSEQVKHPLPALFLALRWGRPAAEQQFLSSLAEVVTQNGASNKSLKEIIDEVQDPADWWKRMTEDQGNDTP